jgi:asparagine synthase (glutamine-hydrolysing)
MPDFQLHFFDTKHEISVYQDNRFVVLMTGFFFEEDTRQSNERGQSHFAEQLLASYYKPGLSSLKSADGHFSAILFDSFDRSITTIGDRFHRYSIVYTGKERLFLSSHTALLYPFLSDKRLNYKALSQSIDFRWLTGERKLFDEIRQVLPGSVTRVNARGKAHVQTYSPLNFQRQENRDQQFWVREVDTAIDKSLAKISAKTESIGVPLSGGVDSSLLLAKATEHFRNVVAISVRFVNGDNPELDSARSIARQIGVRHVVVDLDDDYVYNFFPTMIRLHEQPPRNYSDFALAKILEHLSGEVDSFLYGEGADTLFGLNVIHKVVSADRASMAFRRLPQFLKKFAASTIPNRSPRMRRLKLILAEGIDSLINSIERINFSTSPSDVFPFYEHSSWDEDLSEFLAHGSLPVGDRASIQLLATGVMNHIENTGRLASYFGLRMFVPFVLNDVRAVAMQMPFELQNANGSYKTILRELACRYIDRRYVYSTKYGFPTPAKNWLTGPLIGRVNKSCLGVANGSHLYSADALSLLSIDSDFEHFWFSICIDELMAHIQNQEMCVPNIA